MPLTYLTLPKPPFAYSLAVPGGKAILLPAVRKDSLGKASDAVSAAANVLSFVKTFDCTLQNWLPTPF